ncbi:hypothetical protein [Arthrobacter sp. GMC3]|uniref:hypothetical protein n=1 Tax=Arthrobacter sp. GMC3 TaxID=2058894 RepID=UPI000CE501D4|nr:hypothetical protein [Arthrobacter sp. GMC3]
MPVTPFTRRRVELVLVPMVAALCMAFIIGAIVMDRDSGSCPPSAWHNQVNLTLAGDTSTAAKANAVTACAGSKCVPLTPTFAKNASSGGASASLLTHEADGSWVLDVGSQPPNSLTFRVFDVAGNLLAQQSTAMNWTRVGGSEQCGGPMAAMKVFLRLP